MLMDVQQCFVSPAAMVQVELSPQSERPLLSPPVLPPAARETNDAETSTARMKRARAMIFGDGGASENARYLAVNPPIFLVAMQFFFTFSKNNDVLSVNCQKTETMKVCDIIAPATCARRIDAGFQPPGRVRRRISSISSKTVLSLCTPSFNRFRAV
jgi:hypothetical protein